MWEQGSGKDTLGKHGHRRGFEACRVQIWSLPTAVVMCGPPAARARRPFLRVWLARAPDGFVLTQRSPPRRAAAAMPLRRVQDVGRTGTGSRVLWEPYLLRLFGSQITRGKPQADPSIWITAWRLQWKFGLQLGLAYRPILPASRGGCQKDLMSKTAVTTE